jgi:hypothetical protein
MVEVADPMIEKGIKKGLRYIIVPLQKTRIKQAENTRGSLEE